MSNQTAELFIDSRNKLGEGPIWHDGRQQLFWFSIHDGELFCADPAGQILNTWSFGEPAAAAAIISDTELAVATASALVKLNLDTGETSKMTAVDAENPSTRSNDSRVGPGGGFWIGTMARAEDTPSGAVFHYHKGKLTQLFDNIRIPNSICFSPDGKIAYFTDTVTGNILKRPIDPETSLPTGPFTLFRDSNNDLGHPDGSVVDSQGYIWNARYDGSCVIRFSPHGEIDSIYDVPVPNVTCPAFGGKDLKTLYLTSAHQGMSDAEREASPHSGSIFKLEVDVAGLPEHRLAL